MKLSHLGVIALALMVCGCGGKGGAESEAVTAQFYKQIAAKQYEAIYNASAPELRNSATLQDFTALMERIDERLGACQAPVKAMSFKINATTSGTLREQGYTRTCANGKISETVTTMSRGGKTLFAGYHAESPQLIEK